MSVGDPVLRHAALQVPHRKAGASARLRCARARTVVCPPGRIAAAAGHPGMRSAGRGQDDPGGQLSGASRCTAAVVPGRWRRYRCGFVFLLLECCDRLVRALLTIVVQMYGGLCHRMHCPAYKFAYRCSSTVLQVQDGSRGSEKSSKASIGQKAREAPFRRFDTRCSGQQLSTILKRPRIRQHPHWPCPAVKV